MKSLKRKELFKKTKFCLQGQRLLISCFLIIICILLYFIIFQDKGYVFFSIVALFFSFIMLVFNNNIQYFLDLIFLEYKITDIVIENKGNGAIQSTRFHYIGGDRKITCVDGKILNLKNYNKIDVKIPDYKSVDQYKLVYLKYSKIIIDSIIITPEPPKNGKKYKKEDKSNCRIQGQKSNCI